MDWKSKESQVLRFRVFRDLFYLGEKKKNFSLLDLGCGFGDLYGFLNKERLIEDLKISYTGYDISAGILEIAKKHYPEIAACFEIKDVLAEEKVPVFDYVVASGIFGICLEEEELHLQFTREMLARMYDLCAEGVAANFLSIEGRPLVAKKDQDSRQYFFYRPEFITEVARGITSSFMLRHDYYPADFTLYMFKR